MGIKQLTPKQTIRDYLLKKVKESETSLVRKLCYIGESCIVVGRNTDSYTDQTGNLRNSIGYVVLFDGKIISQAVVESPEGTDRKTGATEAERFIEEIANKYPKGIVLIVFAGMKYAAIVSARGYDVLDSAELNAKKLVRELLRDIGFKKL